MPTSHQPRLKSDLSFGVEQMGLTASGGPLNCLLRRTLDFWKLVDKCLDRTQYHYLRSLPGVVEEGVGI